MATVDLRGVTKRFGGETVAVDDVSLTIEDGEFLVLLGPSGCGKTTLLRMIAGLEEPSAGEIEIAGQVVNWVAPKDRDIAMVFQNYALYPHMRVRGNVTLGLKLRRLRKDTIRERLAGAAKSLGIDGLVERYPRELSGGQQQRTALARTLVREPGVLLMDEPLSNLDAPLRVRTRTELIHLHRRLRATIVYVTHDQSEAMTMATRVAVMLDGKILQCGRPLDVYRHPQSKAVASFLGSPEMNFLPARLEAHDGGHILVGQYFRLRTNHVNGSVRQEDVGNEVWVGLRPEDLDIVRTREQGGDGASIDAVVDVVEPLGSSTLVHAYVGDLQIVSEMQPEDEPNPGDRVRFRIKPGRLHAFRRDTGEALW